MKVTYIDHMGTDLSVVNAARVSFGKSSTAEDYSRHWIKDIEDEVIIPCLSKADQGLIQFLARGCTSGDWDSLTGKLEVALSSDDLKAQELLNHIRKMPDHWTPFGHTAITLHIKAPIFVARQLGKHQVGFVWNEVSRRYISTEPEFYYPAWRWAADNVKQGSGETLTDEEHHNLEGSYDYERVMTAAANTYHNLLKDGVCPEQARMVLPQSMYTEWYWTGNLYGFANVFLQRTDSHAQKEVQDVAKQIGEIIEPLFPVSWKALTK